MALPQPDAGGDLERLAPVSRGLPETVGPAAGVEELTSEVHVVAFGAGDRKRRPRGLQLDGV